MKPVQAPPSRFSGSGQRCLRQHYSNSTLSTGKNVLAVNLLFFGRSCRRSSLSGGPYTFILSYRALLRLTPRSNRANRMQDTGQRKGLSTKKTAGCQEKGASIVIVAENAPCAVPYLPATKNDKTNVMDDFGSLITAEYRFYSILPQKDRKCPAGNLEEEFKLEILPRFGRRKVRFRRWTQVFVSVGPIIGRRLAKLASLAWLLKSAQSILRRVLS